MTPLACALPLALGAVLVAIAVVDLRSHRIPDALSFPLAAGGLAVASMVSRQPFFDHVIGMIGGYAILAFFGEVYFRRRGVEGLGLGDAKLFGAAGAWLGWTSLPSVLLIASVTGLAFAVLTQAWRTNSGRVAFGPHLALAFWLVWSFGIPWIAPKLH